MVEKWLVVEFRTASLMDPAKLETIAQQLYHLVDAVEQDHPRF